MKKVLTLSVVALFAGVLCAGCGEGRQSAGNTDNTVSKMEEQLNLTQEWDKVFPKSGKLPAIAVCGPFGAVKEQASGLYAQTLAERGFLTIAFDPSFTGESGGQPRYVASPDINTEDYRNGSYALAGGVVDPLPDDAPQFVKDYYAYYKTPRGYHKRSLNSNGGWNRTSSLSFLNMPILAYAGEIQSAVLLVHGENAHSRYFSEDTYKKLQGDNKELLIIPGAVHTDLYDNMEKIPFDKIETFFREYLR